MAHPIARLKASPCWPLLFAGVSFFGIASTARATDGWEVLDFLGEDSWFAADRNNDCLLTNIDVALAVHQTMSQIGGAVDIDLDGVISYDEQMQTIVQIFAASMGDVNADEIVLASDVTDVLLAMGRQVAANPDGFRLDTNGDGVIDETDFQKVFANLGKDLPRMWSMLDAAQQIDRYLTEINDVGVAAFMGDGCGDFAGPARIPDHLQSISSYPASHKTSLSRQYPANHAYPISVTWQPTEVHGLANSKRDQWPANHNLEISMSWGWPEGHSTDMSLGAFDPSWELPEPRTLPYHWPHYDPDAWDHQPHTTENSGRWTDLPGHLGPISRMWPSELEHITDVSRSWPPSHYPQTSASGIPVHSVEASTTTLIPPQHWWSPDHQGEVSLQLFPPDHDPRFTIHQWLNHVLLYSLRQPGDSRSAPGHTLDVSALSFPPSHSFEISTGWSTHLRATSMTWPANHYSIVSRTWARDFLYPGWPANHIREASREDSEPVDMDLLPDGWLPDRHSYWTTGKELREFLRPNPGGGGGGGGGGG